jgi:bacillithiol system protein YtxJ
MLIRINSLHDWEKLIEKSKNKPVVVLKSLTGSVINAQINKMIKAAINDGELFTPVYFVAVEDHPDIANQIEADTGVNHAAPQLIIVRSGHSVYHVSHYAINITELKDVFERNK